MNDKLFNVFREYISIVGPKFDKSLPAGFPYVPDWISVT